MPSPLELDPGQHSAILLVRNSRVALGKNDPLAWFWLVWNTWSRTIYRCISCISGYPDCKGTLKGVIRKSRSQEQLYSVCRCCIQGNHLGTRNCSCGVWSSSRLVYRAAPPFDQTTSQQATQPSGRCVFLRVCGRTSTAGGACLVLHVSMIPDTPCIYADQLGWFGGSIDRQSYGSPMECMGMRS